VQMRQTLTRIAEPRSVPHATGWQRDAIVEQLQRHRMLMRAHPNLEAAPGLRWLDPMMERVFGEWLQQEPWHERVQCIRMNVQGDRQPRAEPNARDVQIILQQLELLAERDLLHFGIDER